MKHSAPAPWPALPTRPRRASPVLLSLALTFTVPLAACGPVAGTGDASPDGGDASTVDTAPGPPRCSATPPPCTDEQFSSRVVLTATPASPGLIEAETAPAGEFLSRIDVRAGGMTPTQSWVYARFTPTGLEKVSLTDEQAFDSLDWDISFRRFVIRVNSGVAGPSCVEAARTSPGTEFATVTSAPASLTYRTEEYFSPTCELVPDGSGLMSPGTVLSDFWSYTTCVQMSGYTYVVHLRDGRHVKLKVLSYYDPAAQAECDSTGSVPMPSGAGSLRVQWAFIP